jgi:hypothetical protein
MKFADLPLDERNRIVLNRIEVKLTNPAGKPIRNAAYVLEVGGETREGMTDGSGTLREYNVPPGEEAVVRLGGAEDVIYVKPQ